MPKSCCAYGCTEIFVKDSPISFHSFPKDPERRKQWTRNLRRANFTPNDSTSICSKHFDEDCFDREKFGGRWLKSTAIPTIFNFPWHLQIKNIYRCPPKERSCHEHILPDEHKTDECENDPVPKATEVKRRRLAYIGDFGDDDLLLSPAMMKKKLEVAMAVIQKQKRNIQALQKKNDRLTKKIADLSNMLQELKQKNYISEVARHALEKSTSGIIGDILNREANSKGKYSAELRSFASTLHFYSPKGYDYIRKTFGTCLPHPKTLQKWYGAAEGKPSSAAEEQHALEVIDDEEVTKINEVFCA